VPGSTALQGGSTRLIRMETVLKLFCAQCGKEFTRRATEHKRNARIGRKPYCSRRCVGTKHNAQLLPTQGKNLRADNRKGTFDIFRHYLQRIRKRGKVVTVTSHYLADLWAKQGGRCVYSGVPLEHADYRGNGRRRMAYIASLDRIDSSLGYIEGNIQFVSAAMNFAKHTMTHAEVLDMCQNIARHHAVGVLGTS
jgi:hypothetical protein